MVWRRRRRVVVSLVYVNLFAKDLRHNHAYCAAIRQTITQNSQATLPRRGSSHSFYRNKKERAGVSRLPLAFQTQIL